LTSFYPRTPTTLYRTILLFATQLLHLGRFPILIDKVILDIFASRRIFVGRTMLGNTKAAMLGSVIDCRNKILKSIECVVLKALYKVRRMIRA
jgi:hypothetical protein